MDDGDNTTLFGEKYRYWILAAALLVGGALRLYRLDFHPIWVDEALTYYWAKLETLPVALRKLATNAPLWTVLTSFWLQIDGSLFWMRLLSASFGILSIGLTWGMTRECFSERTALLTSVLVSLSSFHIYYSQEARTYTLWLCITLVMFWLFFRLLRNGDLSVSGWVGLAVSEALMMYDHYFSVFPLLLIQVVFFLSKTRTSWKKWLFCQVGAAFLFLPWFPRAWEIATGGPGYNLVHQYYQPIRATIAPYLIFVTGRSIVPSQGGGLLQVEWLALSVGGMAGATALGFAFRNFYGRSKYREMINWAILLLGPVLLIQLFNLLVTPAYNYTRVKYLIFLFPVLYLLVGRGMELLLVRNRYGFLLLFVVIAGMNGYSTGNYFFNQEYLKEARFKQAVEYLEGNWEPSRSPIVCNSYWDYHLSNYYAHQLNAPFAGKLLIREHENPETQIGIPDDRWVKSISWKANQEPAGIWVIWRWDWRERTGSAGPPDFSKLFEEEIQKRKDFLGVTVFYLKSGGQ